MKILINTVCFYPNIGGLETMNMLLCTELAKRGHLVVVLAPDYPDKNYDDSVYPFRIIRNASALTLFSEYLKCDVFFHRQISLKAVWPVILWPFKKWVCSHHTCEYDQSQNTSILGRLKYWGSRFPRNIAVSAMVAKSLHLPNVEIIHNAYNDTLFVDNGEKDRTGFLFVGRMVSQKGVMLLLESFDLFVKENSNNKHAFLTIVGDGEEKEKAERFVQEKKLASRICFKGFMKGKELVDEMNKHLCQIVPSTYNEAFGIVALEAMATGNIPLVSDGDGLQEAIGGCGYTFRKGDVDDLTQKMSVIASLSQSEKDKTVCLCKLRCKRFTPENVMCHYEKVLQKCVY